MLEGINKVPGSVLKGMHGFGKCTLCAAQKIKNPTENSFLFYMLSYRALPKDQLKEGNVLGPHFRTMGLANRCLPLKK